MIELVEFSGPWIGHWQQFLNRGEMKLTLIFEGRSMEGSGRDSVGSFHIIGIVAATGDSVQFSKFYETHEVLYSGQWDGTKLSGHWVIRGRSRSFLTVLDGQSGSFELRPTTEDR